MPYVSDAQRRWAHTATGVKALGGKSKVREWDNASRGKKLPERVKRAAFIEELYNIKIGSPLLALVARHQLKPKITEAIEGAENSVRRGADTLLSPTDLLLPSPPESLHDVMKDLGYPKIKQALTKEAIDPLSATLAAGAVSHVGSNILTKALHGPLAGARARGMATGIQHGLSGAPRSAKSHWIEKWLGPEHTMAEETGGLLGGELRQLPVGTRYRTLKKLRKSVAMAPELKHTPVFEDVVPAINRTLSTPLPAAGPVQKANRLSQYSPYLGVPAAAVLEPGLLAHMGVNQLRSSIAKSSIGRRFMGNQAKAGFGETPVGQGIMAAISGEPVAPMSRAKELATDVFLSPAALAPRRIGRDLGKMLEQPEGQQRLKRIAGAVSPVMKARADQAGGMGSQLQELMQKLTANRPK
jgi:hypothetical protein